MVNLLILTFLKTSKLKLKNECLNTGNVFCLLFHLSFTLSFGKHFIRGILFNKVKELLKEKRSIRTNIFMNFTIDYRIIGCIIVLSALRFFHSLLKLAVNGSLKILVLEGTLNAIKPKHPLSAAVSYV